MPQIRDVGDFVVHSYATEYPAVFVDSTGSITTASSLSLYEGEVAEINEGYAEDLEQILANNITYYLPDPDNSDDGDNGDLSSWNVSTPYPSEEALRHMLEHQNRLMRQLRGGRIVNEVDTGLKAIALKYEETDLNY